MGYTIFSNNPLLAEYAKNHGQDYEIKLLTTPAMEVLVVVKAALRQGAVLVSNPLAGVRMRPIRPGPRSKGGGFVDKPLETGRPVAFNPYVSVVTTSTKNAVDFQSVRRIEEALALYRNNARMRIIAHNDESIASFQMADMEMLVSVLEAL
ncbi:MAG: hypothetical protein FWE42_04675 [Defluviitaleaceae bacterium]|nr:hypothetical protein [Defluviitaleaceae bacterium]